MMSFEEYDLFMLFKITNDLEQSEMEISDFQNALQEMYDLVEGYFGYASEIENFIINEDGDITPHSIMEYQTFFKSMYKSILGLFIKKISVSNNIIDEESYNRGYENGKVDGYQGRDRIADIEEDVQTYR